MGNLFKKYWFIIVVGVALLIGVIIYGSELSANTIKGKKVNGENVVYSIGDEDITADEFYDSIYENSGLSIVAQQFQLALIDLSVEDTPELLELAKTSAETQTNEIKAQYGANYEEVIKDAVASLGYSEVADLEKYLLTQYKFNSILETAVDELFDDFAAEQSPRIIRHILVKMADPKNPTTEELAKIATVDEKLASGTNFNDVAIELSDDTGSATAGGLLGYQDLTSIEQMVENFREPAMTTAAGKISEWITTEYGQHLIYVEATDRDSLMNYQQELTNAILAYNNDWIGNYFFEQAEKFNVVFADPAVEEGVKALFNYTGGNN